MFRRSLIAGSLLGLTVFAQAQNVRDPFVDLGARSVTGPQVQTPTHEPAVTIHQPQPTPMREVRNDHDATPAPPPLTVQGIVTSPRGNQALVAGSHSTFMVRAGDQLGDYRVTSISDSGLTLDWKGKRLQIPFQPH